MAVQKVTRISWFDRLKNSIAGIGFGILLVVGMTVGLFWNEGRAVQTQRSLDEGAGLVVSLAPARLAYPNRLRQELRLPPEIAVFPFLSPSELRCFVRGGSP